MSKYLLYAIAAACPLSAGGFTPSSVMTASHISSERKSAWKPLFSHDEKLTPSTIHIDGTVETQDSTSTLGAWIPLGSASCLDGLTPTQIQVCGLDLVVWQHKYAGSDIGSFSAFMDACPHRLAPLSQGRVDSVTGCLGELVIYLVVDIDRSV